MEQKVYLNSDIMKCKVLVRKTKVLGLPVFRDELVEVPESILKDNLHLFEPIKSTEDKGSDKKDKKEKRKE